jgi:hypothetical protein
MLFSRCLSLRLSSPHLAGQPNHRGTNVLSSDWWKSGLLTPLLMHDQNLRLFKTCPWPIRNVYPAASALAYGTTVSTYSPALIKMSALLLRFS